MRTAFLVFYLAPLPLIGLQAFRVRRAAWRYAVTVAPIAPAVTLLVMSAESLWRDPGRSAVSWHVPSILLFAALPVAEWSAVIGSAAFGAVDALARRGRWSPPRVLAISGTFGAAVGALFPMAVLSVPAGTAALTDAMFLVIYIPGAFAGATCGLLLPRFLAASYD